MKFGGFHMKSLLFATERGLASSSSKVFLYERPKVAVCAKASTVMTSWDRPRIPVAARDFYSGESLGLFTVHSKPN